jgi:hypothetical protein
MSSFNAAFDAPHHPLMMVRRVFSEGTRRSSSNEFFPSFLFSLSSPRKTVLGIAKKKKV